MRKKKRETEIERERERQRDRETGRHTNTLPFKNLIFSFCSSPSVVTSPETSPQKDVRVKKKNHFPSCLPSTSQITVLGHRQIDMILSLVPSPVECEHGTRPIDLPEALTSKHPPSVRPCGMLLLLLLLYPCFPHCLVSASCCLWWR